MESNWQTYRLGDIAVIGSSKRVKMADYVSAGVPFYRSKEIIEKHKGNIISTELFISEEQFNAIKEKFGVPTAGDILLTSVGTLGVPYQVTNIDHFYFKDGNLTWFKNFKKNLNSDYLYFWLTSTIAKRKIDEVTIGSTQQALTIAALNSITIDLPPISVQNEIVKHIDSISKKILLNRQINKTLELMAQALFKSWFVDFDPVVDNALDVGFFEQDLVFPSELLRRAEARKAVRERDDFQPFPDDIRQLFPAAFEECAVPAMGIGGWVPEGWKQIDLSELADIIMGQSPKGDTYNDDGVGIPLVNGPVEFGEYHPVKTKWTTHTTKISKKNDLIVCVRGSTTGRYVISDGEYCLGRGVCAVRAGDIQPFVIYQFKYHISTLLGLATGSTFPSWSGPTLKKYRVLKPQSILVKQFCKIVGANLTKMSEIDFENITLTNLRDTLLPKLISGELRISNSEVDTVDQVLA